PGAARWTPAPTTLDVTVDRNSARDCLRIAPHGHGDLQVTLAAAHGWSGTIQGRLVLAQSVTGGPAIEVDVPVTVQMTAHPDPATVSKVLLILVGLTLSPLVLGLVFTRVVVRRFHRPRSLRAVYLTATVQIGEIRPVGGGDWPTPDHVLQYPDPPPRWRLDVGSVTFRAVSSWWNPFDTPRTRVTTTHEHELATESTGPASVLHRLPLQLAGTVVLSAPRERERDGFEVEVVAVIDTPELDRATIDDIRRSARFAASRLTPEEGAAAGPTVSSTGPSR
ncbi:MAG TPA: hypothetical protein VF892_10275, partial [Pseudonocardiaceae bacterium]